LKIEQPLQALQEFEAAEQNLLTTGSEFLKSSESPVRLILYSGLTNARLQMATHPKIKPEMKNPVMKNRVQHLKKARRYHKLAKQAFKEMMVRTRVDEMRVRVDEVGIRGKMLEVRSLEGEVDRLQIEKLVGELEALKVELERLDGLEGLKELEGEESDVMELVTRVGDWILVLQDLLEATK
jgi:hypothetical protein